MLIRPSLAGSGHERFDQKVGKKGFMFLGFPGVVVGDIPIYISSLLLTIFGNDFLN